MILDAMTICGIVCANALYACTALLAATRYRLSICLLRGAPFTVLVAGTLAEMLAVLHEPDAGVRLTLIVAFGAVMTAAACDAATGYVFDAVTLPCLAVLSLIAVCSQAFMPFMIGTAAAGGSLAALFLITRGRGLGLGDVKLACCIGAGTGALCGLEAVALAFVLGGAYAAYLLAAKRANRSDELRFAPYLAAGMSLAVLQGGLR